MYWICKILLLLAAEAAASCAPVHASQSTPAGSLHNDHHGLLSWTLVAGPHVHHGVNQLLTGYADPRRDSGGFMGAEKLRYTLLSSPGCRWCDPSDRSPMVPTLWICFGGSCECCASAAHRPPVKSSSKPCSTAHEGMGGPKTRVNSGSEEPGQDQWGDPRYQTIDETIGKYRNK